MATKINETIWGTVPTSGGNIRSNRSLRDLIAAGLYNPVTGNFDMSISPWGIGHSNAGNYSVPWLTRTGEAASESGNKVNKVGFTDSASYNTPFVLGAGAEPMVSNYSPEEYTRPMQRIYGGTAKDNNNYIVSAVKYDLGDKPPSWHVADNYTIANFKPALYLDYQRIKLVVSAVVWINLTTNTVTRTRLTNNTEFEAMKTAVNALNLSDFGILGIEYLYYARRSDSSSADTWAEISSATSWKIQEFKKHKVDTRLKQFYFSGDEAEYIPISPRQYIGVAGTSPLSVAWNMTGGRYIPQDSQDYGSTASLHSFINGFSWDNFPGKSACRFTKGSWQFAEVSYETDLLMWWGGESRVINVRENDSIPYTGSFYCAPITMITDLGNSSNNASALNEILRHEVAFFGLPFEMGWYYQPSDEIGNAQVYLPVFDEHMITTGEYVRGAAALELPNASWGDVFSDTMPEYDPTYDPSPQPEDDERDRGELTNTVPRRYGTSGTKKYVTSASTVNSLQSYLNVTYIPSSSDFTKDFKGTNPADYIVSVQRYPFPISHISTSSHIVIGGLDTEISGYPLETDLIPATKFFNFGEIYIEPYYDDFRDFQTKITLIMPFIGSIDLDPRLYIGHNVGLKYNIDYDTGAVAAEIKRDGLTLETKTATISITIPFFAANMGSYQNALASTEFAIEQSKLKQIAGITSTALSTGGAIASGGMASDTAQLGLAGGLVGGVTSMIGGLMQQQQLEYQLEHTAPAVGSVSVAAPANAFYLDDRARIIISRPKMLTGYNPEAYAHTVGNACAVAGTLGSFSGYTVAGACDLSGIAATAQEKKMIKQLLQAGVYV